MNKFLSILYLCFCVELCTAQDPEFPKGFIMHAKMYSGVATSFSNTPDLFIGGFQLTPQYTIVPGILRAGLTVGGFYTNKMMQGLAGPVMSLKLKTINAGIFGSAANIHAETSYFWGSSSQRLVGGGIHADLLNRVVAGITMHRDYQLNSWWIQTVLGIRVSKKKKIIPPFEQ